MHGNLTRSYERKNMTSEQIAAEVGEKLAVVGPGFYFKPETLARGKELGLDGFRFYVAGRGGVLGDVNGAIVASAFGYFNPAMLTGRWDTALEKIAAREAGREYVACCQQQGRLQLSDVDGLTDFCAAAEHVLANTEAGALALFAGLNAEPLADDLPAKAMQLGASLREYRGSAHLVALLANGLTPQRAHFMKRPDDYATFGWSDDPAPVTAVETAAKAAAEEMTNRICGTAFASLDADGVAAIQTGSTAIAAAINAGLA
ncbi:MAG: hypothetical protein ACI91O_000961 [Candidatus Poriferisodalaceae bacterium]|jgi:hypothetical protein